MDPAGPFSTPYVLSPGRTAPGAAPEDPYEAREKDKHWTLNFFFEIIFGLHVGKKQRKEERINAQTLTKTFTVPQTCPPHVGDMIKDPGNVSTVF